MQIMDFSALEHNALFFKKMLGNSKLCAVIKNNAYGHGIVHVARYLDNIADYFAVGSVVEAKQISFVKKDILLLLPQNPADIPDAIRLGCVLTVDSFATLNAIVAAAADLRTTARVHIKIDSGMSRLGFRQNDIENLVLELLKRSEVAVEGVYSHFYGENNIQCDKQLGAFLPCAEAIETALNKRLIKHIANSSGALLSSKYHLDMARIGLGLYGYGNENLLPVKSVTSKVISVKNVTAGEVVGYGAKYISPVNSCIAVLNVGYAQGFSRSLAGTQIEINGRKCLVVAVCMAMIMADVTGLDVKVGDTATLLGGGVNTENNVVSIYELLCNLK